jgi:hypothetical protein
MRYLSTVASRPEVGQKFAPPDQPPATFFEGGGEFARLDSTTDGFPGGAHFNRHFGNQQQSIVFGVRFFFVHFCPLFSMINFALWRATARKRLQLHGFDSVGLIFF